MEVTAAGANDESLRYSPVAVERLRLQTGGWLKLALSTGSGLLLATGFFVGVVLRSMLVGVLLFTLGIILFAVRGYLNTGDKVVAGALIFAALLAWA